AEAELATHREHALLHGDDVVGVGVVVDQTDGVGLGAAQAAGREVGPVMQLVDGLQHLGAGAAPYRGFLVDDARDGLDGDLGAARDVFDGGDAHGAAYLGAVELHRSAVGFMHCVCRPPHGSRSARKKVYRGNRAPSTTGTPTGSRNAASGSRTAA